METLIRIAQLLLSLSLLVIFHEFGHFIFAKAFKTRVEKFYLFFDPWFSLFKFKPKNSDTEYGIGWLPLGGYVKIAGMIDESMDKEQMALPPKPDEFRSKKPWQRLLIIVAGVMFNLIMAMGIYAGILYTWGEEYLPTENMKYGIVCDSVALRSGLQNGDKVISVDGERVEKATAITAYILLNESKNIQVERDGERVDIALSDSIIPYILKGSQFITPRIPFVAGWFPDDSPAKAAGMQVGDKIVGIDTIPTEYFDEFRAAIAAYKDTTIGINIIRDGQPQTLAVAIGADSKIGVQATSEGIFELRKIEYGFFAAIPAGAKKAFVVARDYLKQFKLIVKPETKAYESLGGFIAIGKIFPGTWDWYSFWSMTSFLSIMLAVLNILPIPALDGGHAMFILYEMITRRKPSDRAMEIAQYIGLILLLTLLIYANGNDIVKLFR
ncbi:MAG: RIP metalloprotease RseP [Salinivirgaceae bacterium]|nr:RIP metalloprotease RseP [Salinivirgaceae bacterium]